MGFNKISVDTVYIGGGTPSLLSSAQMSQLLDTLDNRFILDKNCEITVEVNPDSCDLRKLIEYKEAGVNRLSVGVQTVNDKTLKAIGRIHNSKQVEKTLTDIKCCGINNISADIMLGLPYEGEKEIKETIDLLYGYEVMHISAYLLKIMESTPFYDESPDGLPDDDETATLYYYAAQLLEDYSYTQYEVSNFAMSSFESKHNMKYWNCEDYIGFGAGAHSSLNGKRYHIEPDTKGYIKEFSHQSEDYMKSLIFEGNVGWDDYLILRLRTTKGLSLKKLKDRFSFETTPKMKELFIRYMRMGLMEQEHDYVKLKRGGFLVSNEILSELLLAAEG